MKKINPKELGLLVKSQEYKPFDNKWLDEAIMLLIKQRVKHCKMQLDRAMAKGEAYLCNHLGSQYIIYVDNDGNAYGHFGTPTYNHMIDYLKGGLPYDKMIVQQALRQHHTNCRLRDMHCLEIYDKLSDFSKTREDLENALTEMMLGL